MPEIFRFLGIRFFYFSNDHFPIHVKNADGNAKFAIQPVKLIENKGMKNKDLKIAEGIIEENEDLIAKHWGDFFGE